MADVNCNYMAAIDTHGGGTARTCGCAGRRCISRHRSLPAARRAARHHGGYVVRVEPGPDAQAQPGDSIPDWWERQ
jgi:hypothetical protein